MANCPAEGNYFPKYKSGEKYTRFTNITGCGSKGWLKKVTAHGVQDTETVSSISKKQVWLPLHGSSCVVSLGLASGAFRLHPWSLQAGWPWTRYLISQSFSWFIYITEMIISRTFSWSRHEGEAPRAPASIALWKHLVSVLRRGHHHHRVVIIIIAVSEMERLFPGIFFFLLNKTPSPC